jgi:hypothetical protein
MAEKSTGKVKPCYAFTLMGDLTCFIHPQSEFKKSISYLPSQISIIFEGDNYTVTEIFSLSPDQAEKIFDILNLKEANVIKKLYYEERKEDSKKDTPKKD